MHFTDYYEILRKNIRKYRKLCKLTQKELVQRSNCTMWTISDMESPNKKLHLSLKKYCLIAEALGISIIDLLNPDFNSLIITPPSYELNENYKNFNYDKYYNIIVNNISKYRNFQDLTQEKLSELVNISDVFLRNIENKIDKPSLETLGRIADALKVDIRLLFKEEKIETKI